MSKDEEFTSSNQRRPFVASPNMVANGSTVGCHRRPKRQGPARPSRTPAMLLGVIGFVTIALTANSGRVTVAAESSGPSGSAPPLRSRSVLSGRDNNNNKNNNKSNDDHNLSTASSPPSSSSSRNKDDDGTDKTEDIIQLVETEVWDSVENDWRGDVVSRWTNELGQASLSPSDVQAPEGWTFQGDWKIVVSKSKASGKEESGGSMGDSMGWEYQFQYLRPPKRRRIWLRSLQAASPKTKSMQGTTTTAATTAVTGMTSLTRQISSSDSSTDVLSRTLQLIRDDWNFKGFGFALFKSVIVPTSFGFALRLPLSVNFDVMDRHPEFPSVTSSLEFYYPWLIVGYLSATVHVEWVKWVFKNMLGLVPRLVVLCLYKVVIPLAYMILSALMLPFKQWWSLPSCPSTTIPKGFFWDQIAKPHYNSELSERIGCSISYRWSKSKGFEFRFQKSYSYMPTFSVYRKILSQTHQQWNRFTTRANTRRLSSATEKTLAATGDSATLLTETNKRTTVDWWQKHFASLGFSMSTPIPDPPRFTCSSVLSLSGLYWGSRITSKAATTIAKKSTEDSASLSATRLTASPGSINTLVSSSPTLLPFSSDVDKADSPENKETTATHGARIGDSSTDAATDLDPSTHEGSGEGRPRDSILSAKLLSRTAKAETVAK